eukprot:CAMPEP_0114240660 /NCGR_PEP_ID=MMETSP0058-20121206/9209_1 /TAXON_ID=36894 /ORGANISM="Pyramimonas parkeae, CCMP726" /LENGTH=483 /DNA_ID=CAMNT_0001353117 /DNA_START=101 /DNA_END=1552 /DNA_ORIENTATION=-
MTCISNALNQRFKIARVPCCQRPTVVHQISRRLHPHRISPGQGHARPELERNGVRARRVVMRALFGRSSKQQAAEKQESLDADQITVTLAPAMRTINKDEWDACAAPTGNPFLSYEFLLALEESGSAVRDQGWQAQHLLLYAPGKESAETLLGCVPLYLKGHSQGEYVFDQGWAQAYERAGGQYYPKLQSCVPFTPVSGARLMVRPGAPATTRTTLVQALRAVADQTNVSSLHITFNQEEETQMCEELGFITRMGVQYHWENRGYSTFDDYLGTFLQRKRNSIRKERRKVERQGVVLERLTGDSIKAHHWDAFYEFYTNTTAKKWGTPYLTRKFFFQIGETMRDKILLVMASYEGELVAGALNFIGEDCIYGRNWGCTAEFKNLHFETCYYQAIEEAIERGLQRVEAGAQGEHKVQRGYLPSATWSSHYLKTPAFADAVKRAIDSERENLSDVMTMLNEQSPYKDRPEVNLETRYKAMRGRMF